MIRSWTIPGAEDQSIFGDTHLPPRDLPTRGQVIIAHGFKGYKDYGMFPRIAAALAQRGFVAHRFNFSHSGMTNRIETFERPDLFERDTWNKQVTDLRRVIEWTRTHPELWGGQADLAKPAALPYFLFGHSRGGVTALLSPGRFADDPGFPQPAGVITAAAPATCNSLSDEDAQRLLEQGFLESPSSRTGQVLRIGRAFLQEQLDDPANHDLLALVRRIRCPILIIHGDRDPTVDVSSAQLIANAAQQPGIRIIPGAGADHVFNTPNPLPADAPTSPQLQTLIDAMQGFLASRAA